MGEMLQANCANCGYQKDFLFGGGFSDFQTNCNVPALNLKTKKLVVKNYLDPINFNGNFTFYNDPKMYKGPIGEYPIDWSEIYLKPTENFCPKCKNYTMEFNSVGCYD